MADSFIPTKEKIAAAIVTMDGNELTGFLFASGQERLIDVVNDERDFVPFESDDGEFIILNKSTISKIQAPPGSLRIKSRSRD